MRAEELMLGDLVYDRQAKKIHRIKELVEGLVYPEYAPIDINRQNLQQVGFVYPQKVKRVGGELVESGDTVKNALQFRYGGIGDNVSYYPNRKTNLKIYEGGECVLACRVEHVHQLRHVLVMFRIPVFEMPSTMQGCLMVGDIVKNDHTGQIEQVNNIPCREDYSPLWLNADTLAHFGFTYGRKAAKNGYSEVIRYKGGVCYYPERNHANLTIAVDGEKYFARVEKFHELQHLLNIYNLTI